MNLLKGHNRKTVVAPDHLDPEHNSVKILQEDSPFYGEIGIIHKCRTWDMAVLVYFPVSSRMGYLQHFEGNMVERVVT